MIDSIEIYIIHGFVVLGAVLLFFFAGPPATLCAALRAGCRPLDEKDEKNACLRLNSSAFNATNAFIEVSALTAITPRHSGSPGAQKAAEHLFSRLCAAGIQSSLDEFKEETPSGQMLFRNVIGVLPGQNAEGKPAVAWIIVGAHYDAKAGIADSFQGANDSGSGVGVALELARVIKTAQDSNCSLQADPPVADKIVAGVACPEQGRRVDPGPACAEAAPAFAKPATAGVGRSAGRPVSPRPATDISCRRSDVNIMFAFFDGEECISRYGKNDGLHGSRRLAEQLVKDGRSAKVRAVIILDMVGDRDLNITIPRNSALSLVSALFAAAKKEGTREKFTLWSTQILDDHTPFLSAGMPAIDIIDFEYGSASGQNDYWHTPQDTVDKLSVQSLGIVGRTVLRLLDDLMRSP